MALITDCIKSALEPYVGATVADTCLRATALSMGKTYDDLTADDMPALETSIRKLLAPVAPSAMIDSVMSDIRGSCR